MGPDRRFVLHWNLDTAYQDYEIHESTDDPDNTRKAVQATSPRTSNPLRVRPAPLRYGVRGRTADGTVGPFGNAVEVLVADSGGTVSVTGETFTLPNGGSGRPAPRPQPGTSDGVAWLVHPDGTPVTLATGGGDAPETTTAASAPFRGPGWSATPGPPSRSQWS